MSANSTEVIRSAAAGPWSLALPSGLALLAFAMGLAEKPPLWWPVRARMFTTIHRIWRRYAADEAYNATGHPTIWRGLAWLRYL